MDVIDQVADELQDNEQRLVTSRFVVDAINAGLLDLSASLTLFVPLDDAYATPADLLLFFNRHCCDGVRTMRADGILSHKNMTTRARLVYTVHQDSDGAACVGGVALHDAWNVRMGSVVLHGLRACLPDVCPVVGNLTDQLRTCYLSGEHIHLSLDVLHAPCADAAQLSVVLAFSTPQRALIGKKTSWSVTGPTIQTSVVVPDVSDDGAQTMLWISLFDDRYDFPLMTQEIGWTIEIVPNVHAVPNPHIVDIHPRVGVENEVVWIDGVGFGRHCCVQFGDAPAMVLARRDDGTLIKCTVPKGAGRVKMHVSNNDVYTSFDSFMYRV